MPLNKKCKFKNVAKSFKSSAAYILKLNLDISGN